ncbi:MAG: DUF4349 domain-containing protein [Myxococcales bacterium]|nr:DUF4349 domain-containing protein [Myxococcales bacterium]
MIAILRATRVGRRSRRPLGSLVAFLLLLLLALTGCGGGMSKAGAMAERSEGMAYDADVGAYPQAPAELPDADDMDMRAANMQVDGATVAPGPTPPPPAPAPAPASPDATGPPEVKQAQPLLIYTADYTMAVYEVTSAIDAVQKLAEDLGGYLVRRDDHSIQVRVPSNTFKQALGDLNKLGDVLHREETVEDVTERFYDLKTRLDNARVVQKRLQQLLSQANKVEDALAVERELARVTVEIEAMEGKLKRLRELIAFSTMTVRFEARGGETVTKKIRLPFPWLDQLGLSHLLNL